MTIDRRWLAAAGACGVAVLAGIWWGRGPGAAPARSIHSPPAPPALVEMEPSTILVHVAGWVDRPGMVTVPEGGRVGDALAAAGGARPGAVLEGINLAQVLSDGQQVIVPGPGGSLPSSAASSGGGDDGAGPLDLNTASAAQLETLPGVGPVLAERIVAHREASGAFESVEDLLEVSGIGEAKLASIRDLVVTR